MATARMGKGLVVACLLLGARRLPRGRRPRLPRCSAFKPKYHQGEIPYYTPTSQEENGCKVELVTDTRYKKGSGWLLRGPQGLPLRRFFDTDGDNKINVWSYYNKQGVEIYRKSTPTSTASPINTAG